LLKSTQVVEKTQTITFSAGHKQGEIIKYKDKE